MLSRLWIVLSLGVRGCERRRGGGNKEVRGSLGLVTRRAKERWMDWLVNDGMNKESRE